MGVDEESECLKGKGSDIIDKARNLPCNDKQDVSEFSCTTSSVTATDNIEEDNTCDNTQAQEANISSSTNAHEQQNMTRKPEKGDRVQVYYEEDGWTDGYITKIGNENMITVVMDGDEELEDEMVYDGETVVIVEENKVGSKSDDIVEDNEGKAESVAQSDKIDDEEKCCGDAMEDNLDERKQLDVVAKERGSIDKDEYESKLKNSDKNMQEEEICKDKDLATPQEKLDSNRANDEVDEESGCLKGK